MARGKAIRSWTQEQAEQLAAYMWAHPSATEEERAKSIGVSRTTLWRYWKDEGFCSAVRTVSELLSAKAQPLVDAALVKKAVSGDVPAIRLYHQIRGEISDEQTSLSSDATDVTITIKKACAKDDE